MKRLIDSAVFVALAGLSLLGGGLYHAEPYLWLVSLLLYSSFGAYKLIKKP